MTSGHDLLQQIRTADRRARAQASHAVQLGEGAKNDDLFILAGHIDHRRRAPGQVDVSFVHHENASGGLVGKQPFHVLARSE